MTEVIQIPLGKIDDGTNVRERTDAGLVRSVLEHGILQPVTVCRAGRGRFEVLYGHRRCAAARVAGLLQVPAIVTDRPDDLPIRQLAENLDRKGVDPLDVSAALLAHLEAHPDETKRDLAKRLGRSQAWVTNKLLLLELDDDMKRRLSAGEITETLATAERKASTSAADTGRPRAIQIDQAIGRSRSIVIPFGERRGQVTLGVDREDRTVDLVLEDGRGRGVVLTLDAEAARIFGRRLQQAGEAVRA